MSGPSPRIRWSWDPDDAAAPGEVVVVAPFPGSSETRIEVVHNGGPRGTDLVKAIVPMALTLRAPGGAELVIHQVPGEAAPTIRVDAPRVLREAARRLWQDASEGVFERFERYQEARRAIIELKSGKPTVTELAWELGVTERAVYAWRAEFRELDLGPL